MLSLVRIGGGKINLDYAVEDCANLIKNNNHKLIVVVGAHSVLEEKLKNDGVETPFLIPISGEEQKEENAFRYTLKETLIKYFLPVYGQQNVDIADLLGDYKIKAVSFYGKESLVFGERAKTLKVFYKGKRRIIRDHYGGNLTDINHEGFKELLNSNIVPVLSAPAFDKEEQTPINVDNDKIAALVAGKLNVDYVFFVIDKAGFLKEVDDDSTRIPSLNAKDLDKYASSITGRAHYKFRAWKACLDAGVKTIYICDGRNKNPLLTALEGKTGTIITNN